MSRYDLHWRRYRARFRQPLTTAHGPWVWREGLVVELRRGDRCGYGEIAPLPAFGSETLEAAIACCQQLPPIVSEADLAAIPTTLPACRFGFGSALRQLEQESASEGAEVTSAVLLPTGAAALQLEQMPAGTCFKWKIGVASPEQEQHWLAELLPHLPWDAVLRLDANGGLTPEQTRDWLRCCDRLGRIEFLEQPLPPGQEATMRELASAHGTPIALDESIAGLAQLRRWADWPGPLVLKPAIAGDPRDLLAFLAQTPLDLVISSVFEVDEGRGMVRELAHRCGNPRRAMGLGTADWLEAPQWLS
jgi:O-succinylbenzoate synthase